MIYGIISTRVIKSRCLETGLENCLLIWNACLCLDWTPDSHFIDTTTLWVSGDPIGKALT